MVDVSFPRKWETRSWTPNQVGNDIRDLNLCHWLVSRGTINRRNQSATQFIEGDKKHSNENISKNSIVIPEEDAFLNEMFLTGSDHLFNDFRISDGKYPDIILKSGKQGGEIKVDGEVKGKYPEGYKHRLLTPKEIVFITTRDGSNSVPNEEISKALANAGPELKNHISKNMEAITKEYQTSIARSYPPGSKEFIEKTGQFIAALKGAIGSPVYVAQK
jgi:hypothetical protein